MQTYFRSIAKANSCSLFLAVFFPISCCWCWCCFSLCGTFSHFKRYRRFSTCIKRYDIRLSNCILTPCLIHQHIFNSITLICASTFFSAVNFQHNIKFSHFELRYLIKEKFGATNEYCARKNEKSEGKKSITIRRKTAYWFTKIWWKHFRCAMRDDEMCSFLFCLFFLCVISIYCSIESWKSSNSIFWLQSKSNYPFKVRIKLRNDDDEWMQGSVHAVKTRVNTNKYRWTIPLYFFFLLSSPSNLLVLAFSSFFFCFVEFKLFANWIGT